VYLSERTEAYFSRCLPSDGALQLEINSKENKMHFTSSGEWLGENVDVYKVQLSDPLGQTLLQLDAVPDAIKLSGVVAEKLPELGIDDEGFLSIEGHRIGLKSVELPCLFKSSFPLAWKDALVERRVEETQEVLRIRMEKRQVTVKLPRGSDGQIQVTLEWWWMWGLISREISWTFYPHNGEGKMSLPPDWQIQWKLEKE
jgi:hypothetical protein